ncbi:2-hydroxyacid dehydrogenase [Algicella marina]|uniref:2-hydroxyacid dehydrogenase n=1 Tax=Algicella marina TaxID=2683284 RepID=A0A6P1SXE4_9RHOB|nr:2-hydroxyacid dehydrogenase [Algicella marina]QHQ34330.1 2-hydroxyacid dehydrogenase [Algicella marina]
MTKPDVLITGSYPEWDMQPMQEAFTVHELAADASATSLPRDVADKITALAMKGHAPIDGAYMDALPNLKMIANFGVGYDAIDVEAADARGIAVTNTPDVLSDDVADLAVAMLIAQARDMMGAEAWVRSGNWGTQGAYPLKQKVSGSRIGIIGLGRIGHEIASRLAAFKCEIGYSSRSRKETPGWQYFDDHVALADWADHVVIALAGGPGTAGLVSKQVIEAIGPRGILVNISRGSTVDEPALLDALESGRLGGAGLDVFENEPKIDPRFLKLKNAVLQPHQASATAETRQDMGALQRENLLSFYAKKPLQTPVNKTGKSYPR